jgi:para-aminobenzoate synthetase/4-amino-4-deoxychorismate lyase
VRVGLPPDPEKGVFETMLVLGGRPVELEAHLQRLSASLSSLFGAELPPSARRAILTRAQSIEHGKLRVTVAPDPERTLATTIVTRELARPLVFPSRSGSVALRSIVVDDGLGAHKWADRALLERAEAELAPGAVALLVDRDGRALEASRGSLFAAREGAILTPPEDGRILPSIARRRVLEVARAAGIETHEQGLGLDELRSGEVFLAGSVRGVEPVRSVDGFELAAPGELSARIAAGLKRRWLRVPGAGAAATVAIGRRAGRPAR